MSECQHCGEQTEHRVTFDFGEGDPIEAVLCEPCLAEAQRGIEPWHRRFELLLANGVSRERANEILIAMMDKGMH